MGKQTLFTTNFVIYFYSVFVGHWLCLDILCSFNLLVTIFRMITSHLIEDGVTQFMVPKMALLYVAKFWIFDRDLMFSGVYYIAWLLPALFIDILVWVGLDIWERSCCNSLLGKRYFALFWWFPRIFLWRIFFFNGWALN